MGVAQAMMRKTGELKRVERAAIECVAERFGATIEKRERTGDARLNVAGKRVAVTVVSLRKRLGQSGRATKVRLRFDKGALRFVADLRDAVGESVPDGKTLVVTITAPIWLRSKTGRALEEKIRAGLERGASKVELRETIHGNGVAVCLANGEANGKVIGFVHNPKRGHADLLLKVGCALIEAITAASLKRGRSKSLGERWLVIASRDEGAEIAIHRQVYSQLSIASNFTRVFVVFGDGGVESLRE